LSSTGAPVSAKEAPARERAIAEISRAVHDFFLFQAGRH
jgi:hypothetical protein